MSWEIIFDGLVMGDKIKVERYIDDSDGNYPIKVTATDKNPPEIYRSIVDQNSIILPPPPHDPSKSYTFDYDDIDDMYDNFAKDSGRNQQFIDELEKSILKF